MERSREYLRVLPDREAELAERGFRVVASTPFSGGHGREILVVRDLPIGDDRAGGDEAGGSEE